MNRLSLKGVTVVIAVLLLGSVSAQAWGRWPWHKKNEDQSANPLVKLKSEQPDKILFDKAMHAMDKGHYDVARLELQTLLNTYPDSEYLMRAKLAVGDTWFKEGGTAALAQAEAEYKDFITFFPNSPEAAEAQMRVADIYYEQMEKPDRDFTNVRRAETEYRAMIREYPNSPLIPRAKQRLRNVQEVLAEREAQIGFFYESRDDYSAAIARLKTVADTYPLYSKIDLVLLGIGDSYAGEAHAVQADINMPSAARERLSTDFLNKAAAAYAKVITRYPMSLHVEDARDRLLAMNRHIPVPTQAAIAESDAEERSRQPLRFTDRLFGIIKHGPSMIEAAHVGEPTLKDPKRTTAPEINKENLALYKEAMNAGKPVIPTRNAATSTPVNEPPRTGQPSQAPLEMGAPGGGTGVGVQVVNAPSGPAASSAPASSGKSASDANAVIKPVGPKNTTLPPVVKPAKAPSQVNDIQPGTKSTVTTREAKATKKPKVDLSSESSSRKKKKTGLKRLNPF